MSTASTTTIDTLFILRIYTTPTAQDITDNTHDLWVALDQGWQLGPFEVILADPAQGVCHILVKLSSTQPPPSPLPPPPEKLFVLRTSNADPKSTYNDQRPSANGPSLWSEIARGWEYDGYQVVLKSPEDHSCFVLIKLKNPGNLTAVPPGPGAPPSLA
jgi:hypothetical protein